MKLLTEYMKQASNFHFPRVVNEYFSKEKISSIDEYLSTKVAKPLKTFPNTRDLNEIIAFLEDYGFERLEYDWKDNYMTIIEEFSKHKRKYPNKRFYMYKISKSSNISSWIRFVDEGTINGGDLHMFCIFYNKPSPNRYGDLIAGFTEDMTYANNGRREFESYDDLINEINYNIAW